MGGKQGLLKTLMDAWTAGPLVREILDACAGVQSGAEKLQVLADGYVAIYQGSGDIIRIVSSSSDRPLFRSPVARIWATISTRARGGGRPPSRGTQRHPGRRLPHQAARIIFWHFRFEQFTLAAENFGWGEDRARDWIRERVEIALLDA
ncbi:MAG TPA: hypothetical protein VHY83_07135 [Solirubrobacteraceae bacterium]|nr:hypothetical protein [Solirubrobacteraceae bacterium]